MRSPCHLRGRTACGRGARGKRGGAEQGAGREGGVSGGVAAQGDQPGGVLPGGHTGERMNSLVAAELLKIRKRWMPYVLLLTMAAGAAFFIWLIGYVSYKDNPADEFSGEALRTFAFPWSIASLLDSGQFWGAALFVAVLTSSTVATEYGWGTVRQTLIRGQARSQYLVAKLIGIALVCVAFLLVALAIALVFSLLATAAAGETITLDVPDGPSVPEIGVMIARSAAGILPYGLLAFALSVGGRSTALGVSGTIGYMFVENILGAVLNELGGVAARMRSLLLRPKRSSAPPS